jgi:hypothetical protein
MPATRQKTVALISAAAAVAASAGIAGAVSKTTQGTTAASTTQADKSGDRDGRGFGRGHGGPGHRGHAPRKLTTGQLDQIATRLNISSDALKTALDKVKPERGDKGQKMADTLAKELGVESSAVQKILEANRPERPATPPQRGEGRQRPGMSALVTTLAAGLGKDEAAVTAALMKTRADHQAERRVGKRGPGKMFSALATELKLDEADVKAAFKSVVGPDGPKRSTARKTS